MTTVQTSQLPTAEALRNQVRDALSAVGSRVELGEPGGHGLQASTPITGEVLFTVAETTPEQADAAIAEALEVLAQQRRQSAQTAVIWRQRIVHAANALDLESVHPRPVPP